MYVPELGEEVPRKGNRLTRFLALSMLRLFGWRFEGELPNRPRFVAIVAPHTTAWDFVLGMLAIYGIGIRAHWMGADWIFKFPAMRLLGGIPVDRSRSQGLVGQSIEHFKKKSRFVLALSPEGSRSKVVPWKTGFYRIASGAGVPILPLSVDYQTRRLRLGETLHPCGDYEKDLATLREFFAEFVAKFPDRFGI